MRGTWVIFKRELGSYFSTPIAAVFLVIFLLLSGTFTFYLGNFFGRGQADLRSFFEFHPWLYLVLIPALAMRLWAEERKSGTVELLFTLPVSLTEVVLAKFLASWCLTALALALTFPMWVTVNILGDPDNGVIFAAYLGSLLMAGGFLAIGSCMSALTKNQVIAFIVSVVVSLGFVLSGFPMVLDVVSGWAPHVLVTLISSFSFLTRFDAISKGVFDLRDLVYFLSLMGSSRFSRIFRVPSERVYSLFSVRSRRAEVKAALLNTFTARKSTNAMSSPLPVRIFFRIGSLLLSSGLSRPFSSRAPAPWRTTRRPSRTGNTPGLAGIDVNRYTP